MIIHLLHHPVSAKRFVQPLVKTLNSEGIEAELWLENRTDLSQFITAIDCPKKFVKFDLSANPLSTLINLWELTKRFLRLKPRAIHAHQSRAAFLPLLAATFTEVPVRIYHNHGTPYLGYQGVLRKCLWLLEFLNCRLATHVITVSKSIRREMINNCITNKDKCEVLGEGSACGIDLVDFSADKFDEKSRRKARHTLGISPDTYTVLYIGRPFKRKGFYTLLRTWQRMASNNSSQVLLVAGCSPKDVRQVTETEVKNVIALGYVKDLRSCYCACDVVALPSLHEGFPYSLLEGAAAGKPLVGSNIPGIDSVIKHNENGLLVPFGDEQALEAALCKLRDKKELRRRLGFNARKMVEEHYGRKVLMKKFIDYYRKIGVIHQSEQKQHHTFNFSDREHVKYEHLGYRR